MSDNNSNEFVRQVAEQKYAFGFTTDIHTDIIPKGLKSQPAIDVVKFTHKYYLRTPIVLMSRNFAPFEHNTPSSCFKNTPFYVREHALLEA